MAIKRVLVAAGSTSRACQKPITETPTVINGISKAAERGAGELATPNTHEVYPRFLLGPSVQGSTVTTVQGAPPRVAGSEQGAAWHHVGGTVERQQEAGYKAEDGRPAATEEDHFRIPRRLWKGVQGPPRGFVGGLGTRGCPRAKVPPLPQCRLWQLGSLLRLLRRLLRETGCAEPAPQGTPSACVSVSSEMAAFKRKVTEVVHRLFLERLERCPKTKEDIGTPFAQVIQGTFPESSKRGSRLQSRLGASTSQTRSPESVSTDWM
ncbi:hypothetical protein BC826DRAFT_994147 [Russula brevipes]|nr:hypothetical protein BC826DRAFT_994147 [Russula brevipes]